MLGHLTIGVRRATQARIESADDRLDAVEHAFREFVTANKVPGGLENAAVHSQIVVARGDDQISPSEQALFVDAVVVNQSAARGFCRADAFQAIQESLRTDMS